MQVTTPAKLICDRCGAKNTGKNATLDFAHLKVTNQTTFKVLDLCAPCYLNFELFLKDQE